VSRTSGHGLRRYNEARAVGLTEGNERPSWGEERFLPSRLSAGFLLRKETIAGRGRNGRDAPKTAIAVMTNSSQNSP